MSHFLLLILAVTYSGITFTPFESFEQQIITQYHDYIKKNPSVIIGLSEVNALLHQEKSHLREPVINKVLTTLKCATEYNLERNHILTIIDYSLPSNEKRLWVYDLNAKKLLYYTYVSHGIKSGALLTQYFSNKFNSKASSLGVYKTEKAYYGREGLSLRLDGLDASFNDNASNRSVVMHGGWYMEEPFIKRYGRPGRSWGCPALPMSYYQPIINTIKDHSLLVAYYPSDTWFEKSKFLNCDKNNALSHPVTHDSQSSVVSNGDEPREEVLFANTSGKMKHADDNPIVVMSADNYERFFHNKAPLNRMLRRQINHEEYIALSNAEFHHLALGTGQDALNAINFVVPVLIMVRGYYETQMKIVPMGHIKNIGFTSYGPVSGYWVHFDTSPAISLKSTNRFIRWLGL